jgi:sugar fermentation stimulation protein A
MLSCLEEGAEVWLTPVDDPKRKTRFTWEMIKIGGIWVGINTSHPNALAFQWLSEGLIPGLEGLAGLKREVKWEDSRIDLFGEERVSRPALRSDTIPGDDLGDDSGDDSGDDCGDDSGDDSGEDSGDDFGDDFGQTRACFIEVKNVSLRERNMALFPDAVTTRGRKHLNTLIRVKQAGMRAVMLYVVQRTDVSLFAPARKIDPEYAAALDEAIRRGIEVFVAQAKISPEGITFHRMLPFVSSP